jgi:uncharacterized protein YbgA (DUF1722 family)/uncharacterized protein YbbK (DUF523 family)
LTREPLPVQHPRPSIVVSKCIEFDSCRYNGAMIPSEVVSSLKAHVDFIPVCPEVEIGLGVPREPIRIIRDRGEERLWQPATERDLTPAMTEFAQGFLGRLGPVDGFILKFRSPSCGIKEVKVYGGKDKGPASGKGPGFFGREVLERFGDLAVEDEGRLRNFRIREHFLTKVFTLTRFREARQAGSMRAIVKFQAENKLLLMAYNQKAMREMGRVVANPEKEDVRRVFDRYGTLLRTALAQSPRRPSAVNVLMHAMGYFSDELVGKEKQFFLASLEKYRELKIPLSVPVGIVNSWLARYDREYLAGQTFFEPYPEDLVQVTDSGKGRDV